METCIVTATENDREQIMALYLEQIGKEFCPWDEDYPSNETIDFDLSRDALFVMKEDQKIIAAISIDEDEDIDALDCWDRTLFPGGKTRGDSLPPEQRDRAQDAPTWHGCAERAGI